MAEQALDISVVLPVRFAQETISQTVEALLEQCRGLRAEVIAVVSEGDPTAKLLRGLGAREQLRMIEVPGWRSVPQLRGEGAKAARGQLIAITEDHCLFPPRWLQRFVEVHASREVAAVGGPIENRRTSSSADWAIYFSRYAGSMPPLGRGAAGALPGNNACYKREALEVVAPLLKDGFWENEVNRELVARARVLWLEPDLVVTHNKPYRFGPYLALRYRHARCFGGMIRERARGAGLVKRVLLSPLIPLMLLARSARAIQAKKRRGREFLLAVPALLVCYGVWFWGELAGYLCGPGETCSETD